MANSKKENIGESVNTKKTESVEKNVETKENSPEIQVKPVKRLPGVVVTIILVVVFIVAFLIIRNIKTGNIKLPNSTATKIETVANIEEIKNKLDIDIKEPEGGKDISYGVESDDVARVTYTKVVQSGGEMTFTLRSSSSLESIALELEEEWGASIMMTTICDDGSDIQVLSNVSIDNNNIMKAEWYDNDLYWTMTTEDMIGREDFLQEVNRVIIANHIEF